MRVGCVCAVTSLELDQSEASLSGPALVSSLDEVKGRLRGTQTNK